MELIIFVAIIAANISLLQIRYFQNHKKLINRITVAAWFIALIVFGIVTGRAKTDFQDFKEDYPIYVVVTISAITIQLLFARRSKDNKSKDDSNAIKKRYLGVTIIALILIVTFSYIRTTELEIEYEVVNGYSGYHSKLNINHDGTYILLISKQRGSEEIEKQGRVTNERLQDIRRAMILNRWLISKKRSIRSFNRR